MAGPAVETAASTAADDAEARRGGRGTPPPAAALSRRGLLGGAAATAAAATVGWGGLFAGVRPARATGGPLPAGDRLQAAYDRRMAAAEQLLERGMPVQSANGDEERYPSRAGSFSKGLPHDARGEVDGAAYDALLAALRSGRPEDFERVPLAGSRRLVNPMCGLAFDTEGWDPHQLVQPPAPRLDSAEAAGEMVELYWMALLRDIPFLAWENRPIVQRAADELSALTDFRGPRQGGRVTLQTLFRDDLPGATVGPYVSQFLLLGTPFGAEFVQRKMRTTLPGDDHATTPGEWLAVQQGEVPRTAKHDPVRRYVRAPRDLGEWVHVDVLFQAYFGACLILGTPPEPGNRPTGGGIGCPVNVGNPYLASLTQEGFGTWGGPGFKSLLCEVATRALKAVWHQKWFVHRRLRPEAYGGRVHARAVGVADYPLHADVLESEALARTLRAHGSYLLPQAFPEGSPVHPSYGAGHATVAGACVTVLKALFDESFPIPAPVEARGDGRGLKPWHGETLTVGGELNKLASNVATGRNLAGVHWRTDAHASLRLGEEVALAVLAAHRDCLHEGGTFELTTFDGVRIVV